MKLVGALYPNMEKSTYRNYFMQCLLSGLDFRDVSRLEAHDGSEYEDNESLCDAAIADGFPFFELLKKSWMSKLVAACQWTWCSGLRAMYERLDHGECMLYMLDDQLIKRSFLDFTALVKPLEDLKILQLFQWNPCLEGDGGFKNPERFPASNFDVCAAQPEVYHGFNLAGDSVIIMSKEGAAQALGWIAEFPYEYLETHILRKSQVTLPGCYTLVEPGRWLGFIEVRLIGSYRENIPPDNPLYMQ